MDTIRPTEIAKQLISHVLTHGDAAIDATIGNGHDTLFLAQCVGANGKVIGFDVQEEALLSTQKKLLENGAHAQVTLHLASHEKMKHFIHEKVKAVMFNLGYLPGSDHALITETSCTIAALDAACSLLASGGIITVVCYPGHAGGDEETQAVKDWASRLKEHYRVRIFEKQNTLRPAPLLLAISKM